MKVIKALMPGRLLLGSLLENPGIKMQAIFSRVRLPSVPNEGTWFKAERKLGMKIAQPPSS